MPNKIAFIEFPTTAATISNWDTEADLKDVACIAELENYCTVNGEIQANPIYCENVSLKYICATVLLDAAGNIEMFQAPALGVTHWDEGNGICFQITGYCIYQDEKSYYGDVHQELDKCNPCAVYDALRCCLIDLALVKDDKAGISFMDTSITFRKSDTGLIERLESKYAELCQKKRNPCYNPRRFSMGIRCRR